MIRIVGWIGLIGLLWLYFTDDAPTSGAQLLIFAVVLLALFSKPINAKVKALAAKLDAEAERLKREEKHQKEMLEEKHPEEKRELPPKPLPLPHSPTWPSWAQEHKESGRDLDKEAWCLYHTVSEPFLSGAVDACTAVLSLFVKLSTHDLAQRHPDRIINSWTEIVRNLKESVHCVLHQNNYTAMLLEPASLRCSLSGYISHCEPYFDEDYPVYSKLSSIASRYTSQIEIVMRLALYGGEYWRDDATSDERRNTAWGLTKDNILLFHQYGWPEDDYPHFRKTPPPDVCPHYIPDMSRPCKTGETVPWTGVWIPAEAIEPGQYLRYCITFAIEGYLMQPAWRLAQSVEEQEEEILKQPGYWRDEDGDVVTRNDKAVGGNEDDEDYEDDIEMVRFEPKYEITATTWYPLLLEAENKKVESREAPARDRCEADKPCPRAGYWYTLAKENSRAWFEQGAIMPNFPLSKYGATIWYWDEGQEASR